MTNVIQFPKKHIGDDLPKTAEEAQNKLNAVQKDYIENIVDDILEHLSLDFNNYGFYNTEQKDWIYLSEVMKALLYRSAKLQHFMHEQIDSTVVIGDYEEVLAKANERTAKVEDSID